MSFYDFRPYVSVATKRKQAARELAQLKKQGREVFPVTIEGRTIAASFWGKSWCTNLERYSDYENRLPRGRSYVRNGCVLDLQVAKGEVAAMVRGSSLYTVKVTITPVAPPRWKGICRDCAGSIDSLVELLQGRFAKAVMDRVCREGDGLFPAPREIKMSCSCPAWADMSKHVAAALYGVGARLDHKPELLFVLRGVDQNDLLADAGQEIPLAKSAPAKVLDDGDVAALFGLEMSDGTDAETPAVVAPKPPRRPKTIKADKAPAAKKARAGKKVWLARRKVTKTAAKRGLAAARAKCARRPQRPSSAKPA